MHATKINVSILRGQRSFSSEWEQSSDTEPHEMTSANRHSLWKELRTWSTFQLLPFLILNAAINKSEATKKWGQEAKAAHALAAVRTKELSLQI